jgi:dihydrofolate reductase
MGRKLWKFPKPPPNRTHNNDSGYNPEGCIVVNSMEKAIGGMPTRGRHFIIEEEKYTN